MEGVVSARKHAVSHATVVAPIPRHRATQPSVDSAHRGASAAGNGFTGLAHAPRTIVSEATSVAASGVTSTVTVMSVTTPVSVFVLGEVVVLQLASMVAAIKQSACFIRVSITLPELKVMSRFWCHRSKTAIAHPLCFGDASCAGDGAIHGSSLRGCACVTW
jgi:hypothetical protein